MNQWLKENLPFLLMAPFLLTAFVAVMYILYTCPLLGLFIIISVLFAVGCALVLQEMIEGRG